MMAEGVPEEAGRQRWTLSQDQRLDLFAMDFEPRAPGPDARLDLRPATKP
jgi:hypothetical protein